MRKRYILFGFFFLYTTALPAQQEIEGHVEDNESGEGVSYASIIPSRGEVIVTDSSGKFFFVMRRQPRAGDSLSVSAIGYFPKKIAVKDLLTNKKVSLIQEEKILDHVKVFASLKGDHRKFGYYREWKVKNEGGEIGYIFDIPKNDLQIGRVQVKVNHNYDTCWLKLHLRDAAISGFSLPENEVLKKEIVVATTIKYGLVEFDLGWEPINNPTNKLYVGFELLRCGCSESDVPSFFFMGNEAGENFYKDTHQSDWKRGGEYTIYVRMLTK